jgi:hypothetical protein
MVVVLPGDPLGSPAHVGPGVAVVRGHAFATLAVTSPPPPLTAEGSVADGPDGLHVARAAATKPLVPDVGAEVYAQVPPPHPPFVPDSRRS